MAVSGKTAAPHEIPYFLGTDNPPDMAAVTKAMAERTAVRLDAIAPKQITGVAEKQLLIANASGVVTAVTASGDVTNDKAGVFTIGSSKVTTAKIAEEAVNASRIAAALKPSEGVGAGTEALRALGATASTACAGNDSRLSDERVPKDGSATSQKLKPTVGIISSTADLTLSGSFQDIAGTELKITPAVASKLKVTAFFDLEGNASCDGCLNLDGVDQTAALAHMGPTVETFERHTVGQVFLLTLTAAAHTIKMRARGVGIAHHPNTQALYELVAS